jgi:hypothetical protein
MTKARDLIRAKKYNQARRVLETVDHPLAEKWLDRLDEIAPDPKSNAFAVNLGLFVFLFLGVPVTWYFKRQIYVGWDLILKAPFFVIATAFALMAVIYPLILNQSAGKSKEEKKEGLTLWGAIGFVIGWGLYLAYALFCLSIYLGLLTVFLGF